MPLHRPRTSEVYAAQAERRAAYAAHLTEVRAAEVRVGAVGWAWRIARRDPGGTWVTLDAELDHFPAEDLAQHRRRLAPWLVETLGVGSVWLYQDYAADDAGRLVFTVEVSG